MERMIAQAGVGASPAYLLRQLRATIEKEFDTMSRQFNLKTWLYLGALSTAIQLQFLSAPVDAAPPERPTFNHTADPRPNILPDELYNHHVPYRLRYNRPTYHVGKALYYVVSPTSQEAMVWKENLDECRYEGHNCPPVYKTYYYPKPWEILNTGPRPNFANVKVTPVQVQPVPGASSVQTTPANAAPKDAQKGEQEKAEKNIEKVPAPK